MAEEQNLGVLLDITTACPHGCVYCLHQRKKFLKPAHMSIETFEWIIRVLKNEGFKKIFLYMSGEPLISPYFFYFLSRCGEEGFDTNVATKAALPIPWVRFKSALDDFGRNDGRLDFLIEVPGLDAESVSHICKMEWEIEQFNLRMFGSIAASGLWENVSFRTVTIVTRWNECDLQRIKKHLASLGLKRWSLKRPGYYMDAADKADWLPSDVFCRRLTIRKMRCPFPKNVAVSKDGDVSVCCHDMLFKIKLGNMVKEKTLQGILDRSRKTMQRRLSMQLGICQTCN